MPVIELPGTGFIVEAGDAQIDSPDALATADTGSDGYVNWDGGRLSAPDGLRNFDLANVPAGATVQSVELVTIAYRESGGPHPSPNLTDYYSSETYPTLQVSWTGDGTTFAGYRLEPLPIGGYAGEIVAPLPAREWKYIIAGWPGQPAGFAGLGVDVFGGPGDILAQSIRVHVAYLAIRVTYTTRRHSAPLRVVQRGNDGLGLTGGQRVVQSLTTQASNRVVGIR